MHEMNLRDRAALSVWFPLLLRSGVEVPETRIVTTTLPIIQFAYGEPVPGIESLFADIEKAAIELGGFPCFLRTGHGSDKHCWRDTCFVPTAADIRDHVFAISEWSQLVDMMGLPVQEWVVRKLLPLRSSFTAFRGFPVNVERRYFIDEGNVVCSHCYWPKFAVEEGRPVDPQWEAKLDAMNEQSAEEQALLTTLSEKVAAEFRGTGSWSLDLALADDGLWYAIDMAPAAVSYHWPGCQVTFAK